MASEFLAKALAAEGAGEWSESFSLCRFALAETPQDPDALNLLGRLSALAGDTARGIALQTFVLRIDPSHVRARHDRAAAASVANPSAANAALAQAIRIEPDIACHRRHPMSLLPFARMDQCEALVRAAAELDPSNAAAHAALGNLWSRQMLRLEAIGAYELAVMLDWSFADAHLTLSGLYESLQNETACIKHRREALAQQRFFAACPPSAEPVRRVLVIASDGGAQANAPLEFVLNMHRTALNVYYIDAASTADQLPPHDVLVNGMEYLEASQPAIAACERLFSLATVPTINDPGKLQAINRATLRQTLRHVGVIVPQTLQLHRDTLLRLLGEANSEGLTFPIAIRPIDTHRGEGLERIESAEDVVTYLDRSPGDDFFISPYVDYRAGDGFYRKYRAIFVDGKPHAYHLAISDRWVVHYEGSLMEEHAWMRVEEARFLNEPQSVVRDWDRLFAEIASAIGLEYFGIDFTVLGDGSVLVFEAGAAMLVHCRDRLDLFEYKYDYVPKIFDAVEAMLEARTTPKEP